MPKIKTVPAVLDRPDTSWFRPHPYSRDKLLMSPLVFFTCLFLAMSFLYWWCTVKRRMVQRLTTFNKLLLILIVYTYQCVNYIFAFYWGFAFVDTILLARESEYGLFCNAVDEAVSAQGIKFAGRFHTFLLFLFIRTFFKTFLILTGPSFRDEYNFFLFFFTEWRGVILWWFTAYTAPGGENYLPLLADCFSFFFDSLENLVLTRDLKPRLYVRAFTVVVIVQMAWDVLASCEYPRYTVLRMIFWLSWKGILLLLGYVLRIAAEEVEQEKQQHGKQQQQQQASDKDRQHQQAKAGGTTPSAFFGSAFSSFGSAFSSFASSFSSEADDTSRQSPPSPPPHGWDDRWFHAPPPPPAEERPQATSSAQQQQQQQQTHGVGKRGKRTAAQGAARRHARSKSGGRGSQAPQSSEGGGAESNPAAASSFVDEVD